MFEREIFYKLAAVSLILLTFSNFTIANRIIYVDNDGPADYNNIQTAIDDANNGDTILVADGTYTGDGNRDIDFKGKAITVKSQNGPETCVIDCQGTRDSTHQGFNFHSGENNNSVVKGFTIINGYNTSNGGGIHCFISSPKIENCILTKNTASSGGGIKYLIV